MHERPDPRIERTRTHVLQTTRRLLADGGPSNVTVSRLADEARVSRQTLYRHWSSTDELLADAIRDGFTVPTPTSGASTLQAATVAWLRRLCASLDGDAAALELSTLLALAFHDGRSVDALRHIADANVASYQEQIAPFGVSCSSADVARLIGPVIATVLLLRSPITDGFLDDVAHDVVARISAPATPPALPPVRRARPRRTVPADVPLGRAHTRRR